MSEKKPTIERLLRGHRGGLAALSVASLLGGLAEAALLVVITRAAFAVANGQKSIGTLGGVSLSVGGTVLLALALVVGRVVLAVAANEVSATLNAAVVRDLRTTLAIGFLRSTWPAQQQSRAGALQELVSTYSNAGSTLMSSATSAVIAAFNLLALMVIAVAVDPLGSLIAFGVLGALALCLRPLRKGVRSQARRFTDDSMEVAVATNEVSGLGMVVHTFDVRGAVGERVAGLLDLSAASTSKLIRLRGLVPAIYNGLAYLALVGAVGLASLWDTASLTSMGAVMLVMLRSLSYGQQLQMASSGIASTMPQVSDVFDEIDRFAANEFVDHGDPVERVCPIKLDDVSFEYYEGEPVLRGVTAEIVAREMVGIVGPSGSGKTTLVQLLLGLREATGGKVLAAGRPISSLLHSDWAQRVTFVPQSAALISGTIAENVRFYRPRISDEQVRAAASLAGLDEEIMAFPSGYAHQVGDRGGKLSGGQQQRLCIARALVGEPELIILDEPTSALDAVSEAKVRDTLNGLRSRMAVVVIAHRLSTLEQCDRIMIIQAGRIAAFDTPEKLRESTNFFTVALQQSGLS